MVNLYFIKTTSISDETIVKYLDFLGDNRRQKVLSLSGSQAQAGSFGLGLLLIWLQRHYNLSADDIYFDKFNKPAIKNDQFYISLSHSGNYAALAQAKTPLGLDIQHNLGYLDYIEKAQFSTADQKFIDGDIERFYQVWTHKEAFIKLFGYRPLKEIPLEVKNYNSLDFKLDTNFGTVLTKEIKLRQRGFDLEELLKELSN